MKIVGFRPGGESCGLTRSEFAMAYLVQHGLLDSNDPLLDDWRMDLYAAWGECARTCSEACSALELLNPQAGIEDAVFVEGSDIEQAVVPHPRIALVPAR